MNAEVIVALVTGAFTLAGVVITVIFGNRATAKKIKEQSDLTMYRIEQLEQKQDKHNTLIERMYHAEENIKVLNERQNNLIKRVDDIDHRIG